MSIYFDHNATTPMHPQALACYHELSERLWGNPSSLYTHGQVARSEVSRARARMAGLLGCEPGELVWTSGGSESINWVLQSLYRAYGAQKNHFISCATEHHATLHCLEALRRQGAEVTLLAVDVAGRIDLEALRAAIRPATLALSFMWVNNETGLIHPIAEIAALANAQQLFFHCDAVCALGKIAIDLSRVAIDFLSFSGHKCYGPKGVGGLYIKRGRALPPLIFGGAQESGRRAGTENSPAIAAMAEAFAKISAELSRETLRLAQLRMTLVTALQKLFPELRVSTVFEQSVSNTLNFFIPGLDAEMAVIALDRAGIAVSTGSACTSGATDPSHVLLAMGLSKREARASLRISLGRETSDGDIVGFLQIFPEIVRRCLSAQAAETDGDRKA